MRWNIKRGSPFGEENWAESTTRRLGLESTLRRRGRPRKRKDGTGQKESATFGYIRYCTLGYICGGCSPD